jgi:hypothetical protein
MIRALCLESGLTIVQIHIICLKSEVLSQLMAKRRWRVGRLGHLQGTPMDER